MPVGQGERKVDMAFFEGAQDQPQWQALWQADLNLLNLLWSLSDRLEVQT